MPKTITIKGIGRAAASPDTVVLPMSLASGAPEYEKAMDIAAEDIEKIKEALSAIARSRTNPELSISFTIKDSTAINEEMLRSAARNARQKAEVLCAASGAALGSLLSIDYNWNEVHLCSNTRYRLAEDRIAAPMVAKSIDIEPEDIDVRDTVTFVWEIERR